MLGAVLTTWPLAVSYAYNTVTDIDKRILLLSSILPLSLPLSLVLQLLLPFPFFLLPSPITYSS